MRELNEEDVRRTWSNYRGPWHEPRLCIPVELPMDFASLNERSSTMERAAALPYIEVRREIGYLDGRKTVRLVGRLNGTAIEVVLETEIIE